MRLLSATEYLNTRIPSTSPTLTICLGGAVRLHPATVELINAKAGERILITQDDNKDYFIGMSDKKHAEDGFTLSQYERSKTLQFRAKALVNSIAKDKDLALAPEKKKSIRFSVKSEPVKWNGISLYEIEI